MHGSPQVGTFDNPSVSTLWSSKILSKSSGGFSFWSIFCIVSTEFSDFVTSEHSVFSLHLLFRLDGEIIQINDSNILIKGSVISGRSLRSSASANSILLAFNALTVGILMDLPRKPPNENVINPLL